MSPAVACLALFFLPAGVEDKKPADYAHPEMLIEPAELMKRTEAREHVFILDARGADKRDEPHIPGAHAIDPGNWSAAFYEGQDAGKWAELFLGDSVFPTDMIVIYDDSQNRDAARVWWILRYWGYGDVRLLNGGWKAWKDAGLKTTTNVRPIVVFKEDIDLIKIKAHPERLVTKARLLDLLKDENGPKHGAIVDARSEDEYRGTKGAAKRGGAIPGARRLEWSAVIDPKTGRFKNADELTTLFPAAGIDPASPVITYGDSDGRAAVLTFALELMGAGKVRTYYRGWAEWGNDPDTPVEKAKPDK